jgi:hypothetical protein
MPYFCGLSSFLIDYKVPFKVKYSILAIAYISLLQRKSYVRAIPNQLKGLSSGRQCKAKYVRYA